MFTLKFFPSKWWSISYSCQLYYCTIRHSDVTRDEAEAEASTSTNRISSRDRLGPFFVFNIPPFSFLKRGALYLLPRQIIPFFAEIALSWQSILRSDVEICCEKYVLQHSCIFLHVLDYSITYFATGPNRQKHDGHYNDAVEMIQSIFAWMISREAA